MKPDYAKLIDEETWGFIRRTAEFYPDDAVTRTIDEQRAIYNAMCDGFHRGRPAGVAVEDRPAGGAPARWYSRGGGAATAIYFHGGGFVVGGLDSHDDVCAEICAETGFDVVSVDYRLCPEHKHPAQFDDCWTATRAVAAATSGPLIMVGDSAGGCLAAAVSHHARGRLDRIAGQVLIYPGLGGDVDAGSYLTHANAPMLTRDEIVFYHGVRFAGDEPAGDPTYAPLWDDDFTALPPTVVVSAECDPISDDGRDYVAALTAAGVPAIWFNETGLVHGYLRGRAMSDRVRDSFSRIVAAIDALGRGSWPY